MSILDSYNNIPAGYVPNNKINRKRKRKTIQLLPPYQKDSNTFWWREGDQFVFSYTPSFEISVEKDAVILVGTEIDEDLVGISGQKAYDIVNLISYTCTAGYNGELNWTQDPNFTIPKCGSQIVTLQNIDWTVFSVHLDILNFRRENIYSADLEGNYPINIAIDDTLAGLLKYGSYNFVFTLTATIDNIKTVLVKDILDVSIVDEKIPVTSQDIQTDDDWTDIHLFYDGGLEIEGGVE